MPLPLPFEGPEPSARHIIAQKPPTLLDMAGGLASDALGNYVRSELTCIEFLLRPSAVESQHGAPHRRSVGGAEPGNPVQQPIAGHEFAVYFTWSSARRVKKERLAGRTVVLRSLLESESQLPSYPTRLERTQGFDAWGASHSVLEIVTYYLAAAFGPSQGDASWRSESSDEQNVVAEVQGALREGRFRAASELAAVGARRFPSSAELAKMARVLAPPRVLREDLPSHESSALNKAWFDAHAREHLGRWVAVKDGALIGEGASVEELRDRVPNLSRAVVMRVA